MDRFWTRQYPPGTATEIDINEYASLRDVFDRVIAQFGPRPAYTCMGKSITFGDLDAASAAFGAFLQGRGLKPGARVALMLPNILQYPVCLFGVLRAGYTVVNTNPLYTPRELEHQLSDSGAEVLVVVENFAHTVQEVVHRTPVRQVVVTSIGETLGWKGPLVDFVLRHVKRIIPAWSLPGSMPLAEALDEGRLRRVLHRMLDEAEFLSPFGIRSLSRFHHDHPYRFQVGERAYWVGYQPAESESGSFGGNSNWRGPVWMPINQLIVRALLSLHRYYGESFKVECPTGSGQLLTLLEIAEEITRRIFAIFRRGPNGRRPLYGGTETFQTDPHWRDLILFYQYFHGDNGAGIGASHQTGWTGDISLLSMLTGSAAAMAQAFDGDRNQYLAGFALAHRPE